MFTNDYKTMCAEVSKHQHVETGGNLFGLWTTSGSAVIHVVLGSGRFVNDGYGLCHIGEWHSYHSLTLNQPTAEVEQAVRRNFSQGMSKFLVISANINNGDNELSPYFFTDGGTRYEKAEIVVLESQNPFSNGDAKILAKIEREAEGNHGGPSLTGSETPRNTGSNSHQNRNTSPTYSQVASRSSHKISRQTGSITQRGGNTSSTHSQATSTNGQPTGENANDVNSTDTFDTESPKDGPNPPADDTSAQTSANTEDKKATTKEIIMKSTYDELEKFFGKGKVEIERSSDVINMIFEHESYHWMVRFRENFPNQPAQLYRVSKRRRFSSSSPCPHYNLEKPLTNHINIVLSIKKNCRLTCKICENISKENLTPEGGLTPSVDHTTNNPPQNDSAQNQSANTENVKATPKEIILKKINDGLEKYFSSEGNVDIERTSHGDVQMTFKHDKNYWMLRFPETFPNQPAQLFSASDPKYLSRVSPCSYYFLESPLTNYVNILLSIKKSCHSSSCKICKTITKENLTKPATAKPMSNTSLGDVVDVLTKEITMSEMATPTTLAGQTQSDGSYKIGFQHDYSKWLIAFPAEFPDKPAEVYKQGSCYGAVPKKIDLSSNTRHEQKPLISSDLIMLAIYTSCGCLKCRNKKN